MSQKPLLISVILPCLNEEKTVGRCVQQAKNSLDRLGVKGEVVVCDNGSTDNSAQFARKAGAKVVYELKRGYGSAYLTGIKAAKGNWLVIGDSDGTYDFREVNRFINQLQAGYDLVVGSRFKGRLSRGSMPFLNRFLGTPTLNWFLNLFYHLKLTDSQSGMRAFTKKAFAKLKLKSVGMEFASEMLVRAAQENLKISEVPISYAKRITPSKLSRFRDAWRHIRFMFLFAPTYLFIVPGLILLGIGLAGVLVLFRGPWLGLDYHSMILASMLALLGYQVVMMGVYAKAFSWTQRFNQKSLLLETTLRYFKLEKGIILGALLSLVGLVIGLVAFINWAKKGFGELSAIRPAVLSMTLVVLGIQIIFSSFFLSILGIEKK